MEGRRGEAEACWLDGLERLEVGEAEGEQRDGQEEQRDGQEELGEERQQGKRVGACCHEKEREEQRMKEQVSDGWSFEAPPSCEAQGCLSCLMTRVRSTAASGKPMSLSETL